MRGVDSGADTRIMTPWGEHDWQLQPWGWTCNKCGSTTFANNYSHDKPHPEMDFDGKFCEELVVQKVMES